MAAKKVDSPDKRILKGEKTRNNIIQAAVMLFSERGFDGTSVKDITDAAGVPKSLFYHYFKSMEELFIYIIDASSLEIAPEEKGQYRPGTIAGAVESIYDGLKGDKVNLKIIFLEALKNKKVFSLLLERLDHLGHGFNAIMPEDLKLKYDSKELAILRLYYRILPMILLVLTEEQTSEYYGMTSKNIKDLLINQMK
jgi:AcrR family transcriptional regulator